MGLATAQKTLTMISKLPSDAPMKAVIDSRYQKSPGRIAEIAQSFERATPESVGVSSEAVLSFLKNADTTQNAS